jgi:hypothetical protein
MEKNSREVRALCWRATCWLRAQWTSAAPCLPGGKGEYSNCPLDQLWLKFAEIDYDDFRVCRHRRD